MSDRTIERISANPRLFGTPRQRHHLRLRILLARHGGCQHDPPHKASMIRGEWRAHCTLTTRDVLFDSLIMQIA